MKVPNGEGVATRTGSESCAVTRKGGREVLTGGRAGRDIELRNSDDTIEAPTLIARSGRQHSARRYRETGRGLARSETLACTDAPHAGTGRSRVPPWRMAPRDAPESPRT